MTRIDKILSKSISKKHWRNISEYCNGYRHPLWFGYRKYRRGNGRCHSCGAKLGKIKCERKSFSNNLVDNIFSESPFFRLLKQRD
jgi:hypothetical protein